MRRGRAEPATFEFPMGGELMTTQLPSVKESLIELKDSVLRYRFIILALVMAVVGFLLLVFRDRLPYPEYERDFGIAILTAGTIGLVVELYTRRQFETIITDRLLNAIEASSLSPKLEKIALLLSLGNELTSLGLKRIYALRSDIDFAIFLDAADPGSEIRLLGVSMMSFISDRMRPHILKKIEEGCTIKILVLDSESDFVRQRALEEGRSFEDIHKEIEATDILHRSFIDYVVPAHLRKNIEFGHYDSAPTYLIVSTNRAMIVGFYLREGRGMHFPHLELVAKGGGIYISFQKHFDSLWAVRKEAKVVEVDEPVKLQSVGML